MLDRRNKLKLLSRQPLAVCIAVILTTSSQLPTIAFGQTRPSVAGGAPGRAHIIPPVATSRSIERPPQLAQAGGELPAPRPIGDAARGQQQFPPTRGGEPLQDGIRPAVVHEQTRDLENPFLLERVDPRLTLELQVGRPTILRLRQAPFRDQVADPGVIDVLNITETEYSITGTQIGTTVLNFWFESPAAPDGRVLISYLVRVLDDPEIAQRYQALLAGLEQSINRAFPNSAVRLSYVGNQVLVRGQARDIEEGTQILNIVARSLPREEQVERPFDPEEFFIADAGPQEIAAAGGIDGLLQGQAGTGANGTRINNRIVNLLEIGGIHQVMLKVTVAEVNRSAVRAIGADLRIGSGSTNFFSLLPLAELGMAGTGGTLLVNRGDFDLAINALKQLNLAKSLAEPNLVTMNGQPANFQVGGQFPVPQVTGFTGAGLQGVEFVPFGVQLQFVPNVTDGDRIRLNLQATVSTRTEDTTNINGSSITGLNSRNFQSTVELREGQTIAIAGLIQSNLGATSDRVPFAGDLPILGRLFSSDRTSYDEQELIVLVTPYLVNPIDATREPLPLPGSDYFEPDDLEFFLRGSLTGHFAEDFRSPARTDIHQIKAFRRLEQELIIGQPGHSNGLLCPSVEMKVHP